MKALSEKEQELLKILLSDNKALDNFLIESNSPRLLPSLNGGNSKGVNIFSHGHAISMDIWKERSAFIWPSFYLERIAERFKKTELSNDIKQEYVEHILVALKNIVRGYSQSNKPDFVVVQIVIRVIKNLGVRHLDEDILNFINTNLKGGCADALLWGLIDLLKALIDEKNPKVELLISTMVDTSPNNICTNNSHFYYLVEDFFNKKENIEKLAEFCSIDFILNIANKLSNALDIRENLVIEEEIEMDIQDNHSINVSIRNTNIKFNLPYVEFSDKQNKIRPIVEDELSKYDVSKKQKRIEQILHFYTQIWGDLTYISYPSLNKTPSSSYKEQESLLIYILKEILRIRLNRGGIADFNELYVEITKNNKNFIFKRIFLYCYGKEFEKTREELFRLIDIEKALLFSHNFEAEIYGIMEENTLKFTEKEKEIIENWIQGGPYEEIDWLDVEDISKYKSNEAKIHWQQERYAPLKTIEPFKSKYQALRDKTKMKEFFNFKDGGEFHPTNYQPMISDQEALSQIKNNPSEYVNGIKKFAQEQHSRVTASMHDIPHSEGNADQLQRLARSFPRDITEAIGGLSGLRPVYIMHILYGLREAQDRQNILWPNLFKFIETYVDNLPEDTREKSEDPIEDDIINTPKGRNKEFTIGAFSDIISIQSDSVLFDRDTAIDLLSKFLKILLKDYQFISPMHRIVDGKEVAVDYLTMTINTPLGRVLEKLLSLIITRKISDIESIRDLYDDMLKNKVVEAHVFLGLYFVYFYQTMQEWTTEKTKNLLDASTSADGLKYWEMFFEGFIKSNVQYLNYYDWMLDHYKKAIDVYSNTNVVRLPDALGSFFLAGKDKLDENSLIKYCYQKSAFEILSRCVSNISFKLNKGKFYGHVATEEEIEEEKKITPKANELWNFLWQEINNEKLKNSTHSDNIKHLLEEMLDLIPALTRLDIDNYGRISQILEGVKSKVKDTSYIFSDLIYLASKQNNDENAVLYLGRIYKKIIETMDYFTIEDSHKAIIDMLTGYSSDVNIKKILDEIKSIYVKKSWNKYLGWFKN